MSSDDREEPVLLTLMESGVLCHLLMSKILDSGGTEKQPAWVMPLYQKLADVNDKLRGHS
jgi:hypothetical protein